MGLTIYFVFEGKTKEAIALYEKAFETEVAGIKTFRNMPQNEGYISEEALDNVLHAEMDILGTRVMFSDTLPGMAYAVGNNVTIAVVHHEQERLKYAFDLLALEGGEVIMPLQETPWSKCYGQVTDRFGVQWQFNLEEE